MVIAARFEQLPGDPATARDPRRTLRLEAAGLTGSGDAAGVLVHNISASGMLLESELALAPGERIGVELPHAGRTLARVVWASGSFVGCQFDEVLSSAALSAAQLRGEPAQGPGPVGEAFGVRLQRLRKAQGLTLAQLAGLMGVSKPTVWAWEHGKAHPVEGRMDALAHALEVPAETLLVDRGGQFLPDLLARARMQIASALGVTPGQIRIEVDL